MTLPTFICVGAPKCGTTSLYDILGQHPDIALSSFKEPHFFNIPENYAQGVSFYEKEYFSHVKSEKCIGEFTPSYLFDSSVPERMKKDLGAEVKIIIMLRNPVDRAYSHYLHSVRDGFEPLKFEEALEKENSRLVTDDYYEKLRYSYVQQGMYAQHITHYLKFFASNQIKIVLFEDFISRRELVVADILSFLKLSKIELNTNLRSNPARVARFSWVNRLLKSDGIFKRMLKALFQSKRLRQIIRTSLMEFNAVENKIKPLSVEVKKKISDKYFAKEIQRLEKVLNKSLQSWMYN